MGDLVFSAPKSQQVDLLIIAGEASGDEHSSLLVEGLKKKIPSIKISALGGDCLKEKGAHLVYPLVNHAVVGLFEVLKNYRLFKRIFSQTLIWIKEFKPNTILLVDYPGFNLRIAKELKKLGLSNKGGGKIMVLQYISPQLWAWKPKRRFEMEKILDSLAVLFPFEIECYNDTNLPVFFVGHPFTDAKYESPFFYSPSGSILILPGSRFQAVERILPVFLDTCEILFAKHNQLDAKLIVPNEEIRLLAQNLLDAHPKIVGCIQIIEGTCKIAARAALMSSGTMSLSCAIAGIPGVIAYRAHPLTYLIGRAVLQISFLGMANILLSENPPYPEFIQNRANGRALSKSLEEVLNNTESNAESKQVSDKLINLLKAKKEKGAVDWLIQEASLG